MKYTEWLLDSLGASAKALESGSDERYEESEELRAVREVFASLGSEDASLEGVREHAREVAASSPRMRKQEAARSVVDSAVENFVASSQVPATEEFTSELNERVQSFLTGEVERLRTERFEELSREWKEGSGVSSSPDGIGNHPAYRAIVEMGPEIVPLIIASLEREPDHWFWALTELTGVDPVPAESRGNLHEMRAAWLSWWESRESR